MQYFLHKELGHVASLDDAETPGQHLLDPHDYIPVHLHTGPGELRNGPPKWFRVFFSVLVSTVILAVVAGAVGGLVLIWKAVVS